MAATPRPATANVALLLVRLILATVFLYHGSQKLFGWFGGGGIAGTAGYFAYLHLPLPTLNAWLSALAEFLGGVFLLIGSGLRIALIPLIINMIVATLVTLPGGFNVMTHGCEYPLTLLVVLIALEITGPGVWTLGNLLMGDRPAVGGTLSPTATAR